MDVIKRKILALLQCALTLAKQATGKLLSWYLDKVRDNNVLQWIYALWFSITNRESARSTAAVLERSPRSSPRGGARTRRKRAAEIEPTNHLVSIMNIGNQLYSRLSQLTTESFLMQTELPTLLNVFETDYELQYNESYTASRQK